MLGTVASVTDFITAAGGTVTANTTALVTIIAPQADRAIKDFVGYEIEQATYAEYHPTKGLRGRMDGATEEFALQPGGSVMPFSAAVPAMRELVLQQLPVRSITSILEGAYPPSAVLDSSQYQQEFDIADFNWSGCLYRLYGGWNRAFQSTLVNYVAGLTTGELATRYPNFRKAFIDTCMFMLTDAIARARAAMFGGVPGSVGITDFSVTFVNPATLGSGSFFGAGVGATDLPTSVKMLLQP